MTVGRDYPWIHFLTLVAIPTAYWISIIEIASMFAGSDQEFSWSYGQVSALCPHIRYTEINILLLHCRCWRLPLQFHLFSYLLNIWHYRGSIGDAHIGLGSDESKHVLAIGNWPSNQIPSLVKPHRVTITVTLDGRATPP